MKYVNRLLLDIFFSKTTLRRRRQGIHRTQRRAGKSPMERAPRHQAVGIRRGDRQTRTGLGQDYRGRRHQATQTPLLDRSPAYL